MEIIELIRQYESDAERIRKRIDAISRRMVLERSLEARRKFGKRKAVLEEEYREIVGDIIAMKRGIGEGLQNCNKL